MHNRILNFDECGKHICQSKYERKFTALDQKLNDFQVNLNECMNTTEFFGIMSKYINYCDMLKLYNLGPNEIPFEAVNITNVSTCTE